MFPSSGPTASEVGVSLRRPLKNHEKNLCSSRKTKGAREEEPHAAFHSWIVARNALNRDQILRTPAWPPLTSKYPHLRWEHVMV